MKSRIRILASLVVLALAIAFTSCDSEFAKIARALPAPRTTPGLERIEFKSVLLGKTMGLYAYLPPGYTPDKEWPVIYLLHGFGNDEIEWFEYHKLNEVADRLIAEGKMEPSIIIAPRMDNSWGLDSGKPKMMGPGARRALFAGPYESYFLKEVMYLAETRYHASKKPAERSLGGISMGGFAALHIGLRHPELFAKIGGHSPALRGTQIPEFFLYAKPMKRETCDPIALAKTRNLSGLRVFVDCGSDDGLFAGAKEFADVLASRKVDVTFFTAPGAHSGDYWHPNLERYLMFYAGK
jgi:enterochelin esterase-like enzyme